MPLAEQLAVPKEALDAARHLAYSALRAGRRKDARFILEGCVGLDPHDTWSLSALAKLALYEGDFATAQQCAVTLNSMASADPSVGLLIAQILVAQHQNEEALGWLQNVVGQGGDLARVAKAILSAMTQ